MVIGLQDGLGLLLGGDNVACRAALGSDFFHAAVLDFGRLFSRLLDLQEDGTTGLEAQQVRNASQLVRPAVDLHDPPAGCFGYPNNRGDYG